MLSSLDDLAGKVSPGSGKDSPQQHFDNNANAATKIRHLNHIVHPYSRQDVAKEKWVLQGSSWTVEEELGMVFHFIISLSPSPSFTCRFTWQREVNDWMRVWDHPGKLIPPLLFYWKVIVIELQCSSSRWCVVGKGSVRQLSSEWNLFTVPFLVSTHEIATCNLFCIYSTSTFVRRLVGGVTNHQ